MRFLLFEVHGITKHYEALAANGDNETCDAETIDMIMDATASLCTNELAPINAAADRDGLAVDRARAQEIEPTIILRKRPRL